MEYVWNNFLNSLCTCGGWQPFFNNNGLRSPFPQIQRTPREKEISALYLEPRGQQPRGSVRTVNWRSRCLSCFSSCPLISKGSLGNPPFTSLILTLLNRKSQLKSRWLSQTWMKMLSAISVNKGCCSHQTFSYHSHTNCAPGGNSGRRKTGCWPRIDKGHIKEMISASPDSCIFPYTEKY